MNTSNVPNNPQVKIQHIRAVMHRHSILILDSLSYDECHHKEKLKVRKNSLPATMSSDFKQASPEGLRHFIYVSYLP